MSEWMPVLLGAVLGVVSRRYALSRRTVAGSALVAAIGATMLSGEWTHAPYLVIADALLVGAGILAGRAAYHSWAASITRRST